MRLHGQKWKELSDAQRAKFQAMAEEEKTLQAQRIQESIAEEQQQLKNALRARQQHDLVSNDSMVQKSCRFNGDMLAKWQKAVTNE
eukprot:552126-Amphidinium_carterae.1